MNVLITGASRGLGLTICKLLLSHGHLVYAVNRNFSEELAILNEKYPNQLHFFKYDFNNVKGIRDELFKVFLPNSVRIDGFVNNAAFAYDDIITNIDVDKLETLFRVNVFSPLNLVKYAIRNMLFNKTSGSIVHISSICVHTGYKGLAMYAATKGAIEAFSKNTAREWGNLGIRSNVVIPGFMDTDMSSSLSTEEKEKIYNRTSLKKETSMLSVAETVLFLLSDKTSSITGQNITVDSGTI